MIRHIVDESPELKNFHIEIATADGVRRDPTPEEWRVFLWIMKLEYDREDESQ